MSICTCSAYKLIMAYMHYSLCLHFQCSAICQCGCGLAIASNIYNALSGQSACYMCPGQSTHYIVLTVCWYVCILGSLLATCVLVSLLLRVSWSVYSLHCPQQPAATCAFSVVCSLHVSGQSASTCVLVSLLTTLSSTACCYLCPCQSVYYMCPHHSDSSAVLLHVFLSVFT